jgi:hypothetical protein
MVGPYGTDRTILGETRQVRPSLLDTPWTPQSKAFSRINSMLSIAPRWVSDPGVPVSTTEWDTSKRDRLIGLLVHRYGWILGQDGNLYSPNPVETAWGERVA